VDGTLRQCFRDSRVHKWALYWADGSRTLQEIRELASAEADTAYSQEQITAFFQAMAEIGYVKLVPLADLLTRDRLVHDLRALGVHAGMDVMVHSSLSSLGFVRGVPSTVVEALLEAIGPDGTLMMPSFNHRSAHVFNPMTTPTTNGAIPDAMWRRPDAVRSLHPTHAVAAIGPKAHAWCQDHLTNGIWAADSPIGRLVHQGGYILGLGVDHNASTAYHVAETSMPAPCLDAFGSRHRIVAPDGTVQTVPGLAWRNGGCPVPPAKLSGTLDARELQVRGHVGNAACVLVKAIDLWNVRREHLRDSCPTCTVRPKIDS
jgi:aminoglycoside 3-N-acetyltransferase